MWIWGDSLTFCFFFDFPVLGRIRSEFGHGPRLASPAAGALHVRRAEKMGHLSDELSDETKKDRIWRLWGVWQSHGMVESKVKVSGFQSFPILPCSSSFFVGNTLATHRYSSFDILRPGWFSEPFSQDHHLQALRSYLTHWECQKASTWTSIWHKEYKTWHRCETVWNPSLENSLDGADLHA